MHPVLKQISDIGIVPVIAIDGAEKAVPLAKALVAGGLPVAEVTFRTAAGEAAIRAISREVPEMLVGAGTVLTHDQLDRALDAGDNGAVEVLARQEADGHSLRRASSFARRPSVG